MTIDAGPADPSRDDGRGARPWRLRGGWADRLEVLAPLVAYVAMVLAGITTSSIGMLRMVPSQRGDGTLFDPLPIRSDEWLTAAPLELGTMAHGSALHPALSYGPDLIYQLSSGSVAESVLFFEGNLLRLGPWLPDAMLFAAFRGFSWLLLFWCLPPLLRRLGANRPLSWLAVALSLLAPAAIWWSFIPIRTLGFAAAGCYLLVLARDRLSVRSWPLGLAQAAGAGLCLARLVTYYVPWSLTVGLPLVLATGVWLVWDRRARRAGLLAVAAGAVVGLVLVVGTFWENSASLSAELNTVYPGQRRSTGMALTPFQLWGAPGLTDLKSETQPVGTNQSEVSSAFLVAGLAALMLWPGLRATWTAAQRAAYVALAAATVVLGTWTLINFGTLGEHLPLLNRIPPGRVAQTLGFPAALMFCLVLSCWARRRVPATAAEGRWQRPLAVAAVVGIVTAYGVSDLQRPLPGVSTLQMWLTAAGVAALAFVLVRFPTTWWASAVTAVVLLAFAFDVNPVMAGLGDLRSGAAAEEAVALRTQAERTGRLVVGDTMLTDALLVANGVPMLNGYQVTGPDRAAWKKVDPTGQYEDIWNRGASYLLVSVDNQQGAAPVVVADNGDVIRISTDPCWLADSPFRVGVLVSQAGVTSPCAQQVSVFRWNGAKQYVYDLTPQ